MPGAVSPLTLSAALRDSAVQMAVLRRRYGAQMAIAGKMLGVEPNSHAYLEIWPTGLRSYNLLVPNFLNMPLLLFGAGVPKRTIGLVMYAASQASGCAYCTAHCCTFALLRGAGEQEVTRPGGGAAVEVARALGSVPATLTDQHRAALAAEYSASAAEWIVLAAAMMGFLNKFMDAMGIPLEDGVLATAHRVIGPLGWVPGKHSEAMPDEPDSAVPAAERFSDLLGVLPLMPALIFRDARWTAGAPAKGLAARAYLRARTGHDFPVLSRLTHGRAIKALTAIIADNTNPGNSQAGLVTKHLVGLVYATAVQDEPLADEMRVLARNAGATDAQLGGGHEGLDGRATAALALAKAAATSPAQISPELIEATVAELGPPVIVELLVWLSVLQTLHRLRVYYG